MNMTAPNYSGSSLFFQPNPPTIQGTGVLVLTPPLVIVYMNAAARALVSRLNKIEPERDRSRALPGELMDFSEDAMTILRDRHCHAPARPFEFRREIDSQAGRVILRGIGFPNPEHYLRSYMYVLIGAIEPGMDHSDGPSVRSTCHV